MCKAGANNPRTQAVFPQPFALRKGSEPSEAAFGTVIASYPPSQKATGVNPWMNARWVPSEALAKEGALRRVPPYEACGEMPRP